MPNMLGKSGYPRVNLDSGWNRCGRPMSVMVDFKFAQVLATRSDIFGSGLGRGLVYGDK